MHAFGDTLITISALQNLRDQLPDNAIIDFITKKEFSSIPKNLKTFNSVYTAKGSTYKQQAFSLLPTLFTLLFKRYDTVLDLQNNTLSNFIRKLINPKCYVEFDRYSSDSACARTINTLNQSSIIKFKETYSFDLTDKNVGRTILNKYNIKPQNKIVVFNPAGAFTNRNWPIQNYIDLAQLLISEYGTQIKFLIIGTEKIKDKASILQRELKNQLINLVDKTSQIEVLAIMQEIDLMVSEDGALLHMAYLSKKNTIGIIGSTRSDWTNPKLPHTYFFTSDDLECGNCMLEKCKYHTNECMVRVTPTMVYDRATQFLK